MRTCVRRALAATLSLVLVTAFATAGAVEVAKARPGVGVSVITHAGQSQDVGSSTQFAEGDQVRVPAGGRLTVEFGDQSSFTLNGPATLRFGPMDASGRRVVLASGVMNEITVHGIALEVQAPSPYDASLVLQNAVAFARVNPGEYVQFQKLQGGYAKAYRNGQATDMGANAWLLDVRNGAVSTGVTQPVPQPQPGTAPRVNPPAGRPAARRPASNLPAFAEDQLGDDTNRITLGERAISFHPARCFRRERTADGGLILCYQCEDDAFGVVTVGRDTTLFVARDQCVEFDEYGNVVRFDGISHINHPLTDAIFFDEPVENAADLSPTFSRRR
jgi:hypothetical protein